jgi:hypothetical protein
VEACALPRNTERISALAAEIRDPELLLLLAEDHGVIAHLAMALAEVPDARISAALLHALRTRHRLQLFFSLAMAGELFRVLDLLRHSEIDSLVVKGPVLSVRAYGDPAARRYADLDLLVRHADMLRATQVLVAAGYNSRVLPEAIRAGKIPGEYQFRHPGTKIVLELHTERTFRHFPRPLPIENYFRNKTSLLLDSRPVPVLPPESEFVFISIHGAKDFWERLMWISDVAAIVHNHPETDWKRVRADAAEVGAERMVRLALLLAKRLLRVPVPAEMRDEVSSDPACLQLAREVESWLPYAGYATPPIARRAKFRFRLHGRMLAGAAYLLRLSLTTTEHDWSTDEGAPRSRLGGFLHRPFRLVKKYDRNADS